MRAGSGLDRRNGIVSSDDEVPAVNGQLCASNFRPPFQLSQFETSGGVHLFSIMKPDVGRFENGVGKFYAEDTFKGTPIRVRYVWTQTSGMPHWEQAFSSDVGASWETNWTMDFAKAK